MVAMPLPPAPKTPLSWGQVSAFRLKRHGLLEPAGQDPAAVASRIAGVHAQVMSCAEMAIGMRTRGMRRTMVSESLWDRRSLLKLWAMRGTLHLLPASEIALWSAALRCQRERTESIWARAFGLSAADIAIVTEAVRTALDGQTLTREELISAVSGTIRDERLLQHLRSGWGSLLKPASYAGYLCFGPNQGQKVTFTSPNSVRGDWEPMDEGEAVKQVIRTHLRAYGPVTHRGLATWLGINASRARAMLEDLGAELAAVEVEGFTGYVLGSDLSELESSQPLDSVLLLPGFDPFTVAMCTHSQLLLPEPRFKPRVSRTAGWISPVVLVNGRISGVWKQRRTGRRLTIAVDPFVKFPGAVRKRISWEAQRIGEFLDVPVDVEIERA